LIDDELHINLGNFSTEGTIMVTRLCTPFHFRIKNPGIRAVKRRIEDTDRAEATARSQLKDEDRIAAEEALISKYII
jgi:hypothetical protein